MQGLNPLDLLRKSEFGLKFKIVDRCNEIEAQFKTLAPIAIAITQDTKNLQSADDMFNENALTCQFAISRFLCRCKRLQFRFFGRDLQTLAEAGVIVPLRSQQKDAGRALTHRVQAVELYLKRYTFTQIQKRIYHGLPSIANYVTTFSVVIAHTRDGHSVDEIAFLMQISPTLVRAYQELYDEYNIPEYQERLKEIIAIVKARGFHPDHLEAGSSEKKGGLQP